MRNLFHWLGNVPDKKRAPSQTERAKVDLQGALVLPQRIASLVRELQKLAPQPFEHLLSQVVDAVRVDATDIDRYNAAEALAAAVYPKFKFSEYGRLFLEDQAFLDYYRRFMDPGNWHSLDRKYTLDQLLKVVAHLDGDMAECGTYKGASAYRMCLALGKSGKIAHLFDSFEGLSAPGRWDGDYWTGGALLASEAALRETLAEFANYRVYKGWIPERFEEVADGRFSFVHIDVDLYQPTLESLEFFYPRTVNGGVVLMDDYGFVTCPGAKRAADEFFWSKPEPLVMLTTGQALVLKR